MRRKDLDNTLSGTRKRIAVGLSGGVDSSVAASLLVEQGHDVVGITMKIFDGSVALHEESKHACFGPGEAEDIKEAEALCNKLGIAFHVIDLQKEYRKCVIGYFREQYLAGKTPNPCIVCNQQMKFGLLVDKARQAGLEFDLFATGHYAQVAEHNGKPVLKRAADKLKDQTYFLYALTKEQLSQACFPLGTYTKEQVRQTARSFGLGAAERQESQDFIAGGDYSSLFATEEVLPGDIVDESGNVVGKHRGIIHYTIGQRRGLGIASDQPLYVSHIDAKNNQIVVSAKEELFSRGLIATNLNFSAPNMSEEMPNQPWRAKARIRFKHEAADATIHNKANSCAEVVFDEPQLSITPGQAVVFYLDDLVLGGGIIECAL